MGGRSGPGVDRAELFDLGRVPAGCDRTDHRPPSDETVGVKVSKRLLARPRDRHDQLRRAEELIADVADSPDARRTLATEAETDQEGRPPRAYRGDYPFALACTTTVVGTGPSAWLDGQRRSPQSNLTFLLPLPSASSPANSVSVIASRTSQESGQRRKARTDLHALFRLKLMQLLAVGVVSLS